MKIPVNLEVEITELPRGSKLNRRTFQAELLIGGQPTDVKSYAQLRPNAATPHESKRLQNQLAAEAVREFIDRIGVGFDGESGEL